MASYWWPAKYCLEVSPSSPRLLCVCASAARQAAPTWVSGCPATIHLSSISIQYAYPCLIPNLLNDFQGLMDAMVDPDILCNGVHFKRRQEDWMADRLSQLPDEILAFILSFLSIRDAVRMRALSCRWRHLSPSLSVLQFTTLSLFGRKDARNRTIRLDCQSKFVRAVDQFLKLYKCRNINTLEVHFALGNTFACHIDNWIKFVAEMKIERIDMDFDFMLLRKGDQRYEFPCHLLPPGDASYLKHLRLGSCLLMLSSSSACQLGSLSTLELCHVKVSPSGLNTIFSSCVNLISLKLLCSTVPTTLHINGQLLSLKTLVIESYDPVEIGASVEG
ncbi:hypothetical protein Cgig2_008258 [Carnegiea gigantea]|uniref:F-box domain-containing protein n=1 Tax=Carnegiea gigantea TaxID=171969 RepID=A0A9Q1QTB4_9CARY|nr:hypothetical protein Cgig2_008258 [Carnegiea gigantea]